MPIAAVSRNERTAGATSVFSAMPVAEIFKQLVKMKFPGYVNLEYEIDADDPLPGMKKSFEFMRKVAGEVSGG